MICELGSRGSLLWFIVENSTCLADVTHAVFLNEMLLRLETSLPFFLVDTVKLDAAELPIRRGRFFIRGLRRHCLPDPMQANLPAPLCCSGLCLSVALEQIWEPDLPATSEESLCPGHTANLALYKQTVLNRLWQSPALKDSRSGARQKPPQNFRGGVGLGQDPITAHFRPTTVSS